MIDKATRRIIVLFMTFSCSIYTVQGRRCEYESFIGITQEYTCPGYSDSPDETYCCRDGECCSFEDLHDLDDIINKLPAILGGIAAFVLVVIVLCIVCCCCCPFCLMYKRRNRGAVHQPRADAAMQPLQHQPMQQGGYPGQQPVPYQTQAPYPTQAQPYPTQAQPYPQQQPYPPQQPYPGQYAPPPHMGADQPPPYAEKQMPYNPGYGQ